MLCLCCRRINQWKRCILPVIRNLGDRSMHKHAAYILSVAVAVVSLLTISVLLRAATSNRQADVMQTSQGELRVTPLYHGSVMLEWAGKVIHVDPWSQGDYTGIPQADMFVITHTHRDHLDPAMIDKLKKPGTIIVG